jgi:hypothetical protein
MSGLPNLGIGCWPNHSVLLHPLATDCRHWSRWLCECWRGNLVPRQLRPGDINQESLNVCVAGPIPEKRQKTPFRGAKEARSNEAIGSQPQAAACATERAAHWSDEANGAKCAVSKSVSARRAMRIIGAGW